MIFKRNLNTLDTLNYRRTEEESQRDMERWTEMAKTIK